MEHTLEVELLDVRCKAGDAYSQKHFTVEPKIPVISCEGSCVKGEIARRASNILAHELESARMVRICHGGLLLTGGGMRDLVSRADQVIVMEGCPLACGSRLAKAAFPDKELDVIITNSLYESDQNVFGIEDMPEEEITRHSRCVALKVRDEAGSMVT
jgi:uncharacterized metal-binding protein